MTRHRNLQSLLELLCSSLVLTKKPGGNTRVVDSHKFVVVISHLSMLAMVHVTQIVLLALEEHYSQSIQSECTRNSVVEHSRAEIESLEVLAGLWVVALSLCQLTHLEVDVSLFHEVALLDACLRFQD